MIKPYNIVNWWWFYYFRKSKDVIVSDNIGLSFEHKKDHRLNYNKYKEDQRGDKSLFKSRKNNLFGNINSKVFHELDDHQN